MSAKTLGRIAARARETLLEVVWRQWAAIHARASSATPARAVVDIEALVITSLLLQEYERRLEEVTAEWANFRVGALSVQRTQNLLKEYPVRARAMMGTFAHFAWKKGGDHRWKRMASESAWPSSRRSTWLGPQRVRGAAPLLVRLRLGFGVNLRADCLAFLIVSPMDRPTARDVATALRYTDVATRRAAEDLVRAQLVFTHDTGRPASYRVDSDAWCGVLKIDPPIPPWSYWHQAFAFLTEIDEWARSPERTDLSEFALESLGAELLRKRAHVFETIVPTDSSVRVVSASGGFERRVNELCAWMIENA